MHHGTSRLSYLLGSMNATNINGQIPNTSCPGAVPTSLTLLVEYDNAFRVICFVLKDDKSLENFLFLMKTLVLRETFLTLNTLLIQTANAKGIICIITD
ncbi:hypothetical protein CDAR_283761 [Caerostris darwini]|uniref:Uncharacterized protein n=1 Tax=Caerostris darwini TaxID=1538125 RepID=A0AAV4WD14_9ARAC|nr:hypothetical protein CDAR_283761 [Caerostris darwini]